VLNGTRRWPDAIITLKMAIAEQDR